MILKLKTKPNKNGNSWGLIIDTEKKQFQVGSGLCSFSWDLITTKREIDQLITYTLKPDGFTPLIKL